MADTNVKQQIVDKIKDSNNVLVTVNTNPTVDELSAALGITLLINKLDKHATAVFSGDVPPAIEFLQPEKTFENTVDSLRDFIIALDKEKADHLRYKVVDDMVKIFITPYRTTISEKDLDFSQGDYNVEVVLAIGVKTEADLDKALESHGRILHDATVAAISLGEATNLGGMEWVDKNASSYSEMLVDLASGLKRDKNLLDEQISTAFLTGIVAATERFSNNKTSSKVMTTAAELMAAGANQQLIATKLEEGSALTPAESNGSSEGDLKEDQAAKVKREDNEPDASTEASTDGSLAISHVPEGDVDEVSKEVAEENSDAALDKAQAELAKQSGDGTTSGQGDAATDAEQKLADGLATIAPMSTSPALHGAFAMDDHNGYNDEKVAEPSMGGTLNATTEQAAVDKQHELDDDRNHTILTHGRGSYATSQPTFQSPLNATNALNYIDEPKVPDVLADDTHTVKTEHAAAIEPPKPSAPVPTLAEIDAKNREHQDDAMAAVNAALDASPTPMTSPETPPPASAAQSLPPLPPLPPMPDFSTLPPLPGSTPGATLPTPPLPTNASNEPMTPLGPIGPIGSETAAPVSSPADPAQFRIPGQ